MTRTIIPYKLIMVNGFILGILSLLVQKNGTLLNTALVIFNELLPKGILSRYAKAAKITFVAKLLLYHDSNLSFLKIHPPRV